MSEPVKLDLYAMADTPTMRRNQNWRDLEEGEAIVSDYVLSQAGNFIPFTFQSRANGTRCRHPSGGSLLANLCFPYGVLLDRGYEDYDHRRDGKK